MIMTLADRDVLQQDDADQLENIHTKEARHVENYNKVRGIGYNPKFQSLLEQYDDEETNQTNESEPTAKQIEVTRKV
jgi:hypothetical protein